MADKPTEALQILFNFYGFTDPLLVLTTEQALSQPWRVWIGDIVQFVEWRELKEKYPEPFQEYEKYALAHGYKPFEIAGPGELGAPPPGEGYYGMVFYPNHQPEVIFLFSIYHYNNPIVVLHEFWEYACQKRRPGMHRFEIHTITAQRELWTRRFLGF